MHQPSNTRVERRLVPLPRSRIGPIVDRLVEARQGQGPARIERGEQREAEVDIVRARYAADAEQRMDRASQRLPLGAGAIEVVERKRCGRRQMAGQPPRQRRLAAALRAADADDQGPARRQSGPSRRDGREDRADQVLPHPAHSSLSSVIGRSRMRLPVALNTAFATAAATPVMPISPTPCAPIGVCGSGMSVQITSISGTSRCTGR